MFSIELSPVISKIWQKISQYLPKKYGPTEKVLLEMYIPESPTAIIHFSPNEEKAKEFGFKNFSNLKQYLESAKSSGYVRGNGINYWLTDSGREKCRQILGLV